jgi:mono/diheme cytochrome c family protein
MASSEAMVRRTICSAILLGVLGATAAAAGDPFADTVAPFLAQHCVECHAGDSPKGGLDLKVFRDAASTDGRADTWLVVRERIASGEMPPAKRERPDPADVMRVTQWIDGRFAAFAAPDPGRPTLRRLNRAEYVNTIRDLLGVDYDATAEFPSDDVGYGFDNIGDVLSLPEMLLEKYFTAAERIAAKAVLSEDPAHPQAKRVTGVDLAGKSSNVRGKLRVLFSNGDLGFDMVFPRDGEYVLRARTYGDQAGPDVARAAFRVGREEKARFDVPATSAAPQEDEVRVRVTAGKRRVAVSFVNDYHKPDDPDPKQRDRNLAVAWLEVVGPVDPPAWSAFQKRELDPKTRGSQRDVIARLARNAWRRPVEKGEIDRLVALAGTEDKFEDGVRTALQAVLVSPHFLFLVERDPAAKSTEPRALTPHELAARLSYFLWSSCPDDVLARAADDGTLDSASALDAQVRRMLRDPRASALARNFGGQWLQTRNLDGITPDPVRFPTFDAELATAMRAEAEMFFDAVAREGRPVREFLDADFTFVNERLAKHYGMAGVRGGEMRRVPVDRAVRGGVLGLAGVLTVTSNPTRTSPVKRGKWILDNVLAAPTPPPPPGVGVIDEAASAAKAASLRERLEEHRKNPDCGACHARLDPLGFGLENFDATGAWRGAEEGHAIDAAGVLPDGRSFAGLAGLKSVLGEGNAFERCLVEKLATYALGRGLARRDRQAVDALAKALPADPTFEDVVQAIVHSDMFRRRGAEEKRP